MKKPKLEIEDEDSYEDLMKKVKKTGITSKCYYCSKGFNSENKCFNNKMHIMSHLLEEHKIEVPDELEKPADSSEQCHSAQFQGDINYALSARVISFSHVSDIYLLSDISESEISYPLFDNLAISLLDSSLNSCDPSLNIDLS